MRPRLATVISARPWERQLVTAVRTTGLARMAGRFSDLGELSSRYSAIDAVAVDTTVPWLTPQIIAGWRRRSIIVLGIDPSDDRLAERTLAGSDLVFHESAPPARLLAGLVALSPRRPPPDRSSATIVPVMGTRGAPGCTEISIGLAWALTATGPTLLAESDPDAPGLGVRLGLPPGTRTASAGPVDVLAPTPAPTRPAMLRRLAEATDRYDTIVVDAGAAGEVATGLTHTVPVLVVDPTPTGLVRTGTAIHRWALDEVPLVVVNRLEPNGPSHEEALRAVRAVTGLEPVACIPHLGPIGRSPRPSPAMVSALAPVSEHIGRHSLMAR